LVHRKVKHYKALIVSLKNLSQFAHANRRASSRADRVARKIERLDVRIDCKHLCECADALFNDLGRLRLEVATINATQLLLPQAQALYRVITAECAGKKYRVGRAEYARAIGLEFACGQSDTPCVAPKHLTTPLSTLQAKRSGNARRADTQTT
jgi:hypothetical protein